MKSAAVVVRDYSKPDDKLIEQSQVMNATFMNNELAFSDAFTDLKPPFGEDWKTLNATAVTLLRDTAIADRLQVITDEVNKSIKQACVLYQIIMVYARMAYANDRAKLNAFGYESYNTASRSQLKIISLLSEAYSTATLPQVKPLLLAKGLKESQIEELNTILNDINQKNQFQEQFKNDRLSLTQDRVKTYNELWRRMSLVNEAAKVVFMNDYAKQKVFMLYPENTSDSGTPIENTLAAFGGTVTDGENNEVVENALVAIEALALSDITDEDSEFYIEQVNVGENIVKVTAEGYDIWINTVNISPEGLLNYEIILTPIKVDTPPDNPL